MTRIKFNPDPKWVKWINPNVKRGEERDVTVMFGEGGGIFVNDRGTGEFLWATQFPFPTDRFLIANVDGATGKTSINWDLVLKEPGEQHLICYFNTTSYWPSAYHPGQKSVYIPYVDNCLDMTRKGPQGNERRVGKQRPEGKPEEFAGIAKVNLETGEMLHFGKGPIPSNGATLATAGDLVFHGDLNRRFRAYDAATGKQLWETILGGPIAVNTMTYAVNGRQYVAVTTGDTSHTYASYGSFTAVLTVTDDDGASSTFSRVVRLFAPPVPLVNGVTVSGLSAAQNDELRYSLVVPPGATNVSFVTTGPGSEDADLTIKLNGDTLCESAGANANETCNIPNPPAPGTYLAIVLAYSPLSNQAITGSFTPSDILFKDGFEP